MQPELRRGEHRVPVRAEAVERDVAEVEQAGIADDDVQAEGEQHVEQRVEADADDVAVARQRRQKRGRDAEDEIERRPRDALELRHEPVPLDAALVGRDPLVDADLRHLRLVGARRDGGDLFAAVHQTFCTAARPSSPLGRTISTTMRIAKTTADSNVDEM